VKLITASVLSILYWSAQSEGKVRLRYSALIHWVVVLLPARHKIGHFGDIPQANLLAWYGKPNLTQQKHTFTNQKNCTTTQITQKTKVRFSSLVRHPAWKWRGTILVLALHICHLLAYTLTHLLTAQDPHGAAATSTGVKPTIDTVSPTHSDLPFVPSHRHFQNTYRRQTSINVIHSSVRVHGHAYIQRDFSGTQQQWWPDALPHITRLQTDSSMNQTPFTTSPLNAKTQLLSHISTRKGAPQSFRRAYNVCISSHRVSSHGIQVGILLSLWWMACVIPDLQLRSISVLWPLSYATSQQSLRLKMTWQKVEPVTSRLWFQHSNQHTIMLHTKITT